MQQDQQDLKNKYAERRKGSVPQVVTNKQDKQSTETPSEAYMSSTLYEVGGGSWLPIKNRLYEVLSLSAVFQSFHVNHVNFDINLDINCIYTSYSIDKVTY